MNTLKTRVVIICLLFMFAFIPMAQAVEYPDNPIAGCVGFDGWWRSIEATIGAKAMIDFVTQCLVFAGYSDEDILNIAAGFYPDLPLP